MQLKTLISPDGSGWIAQSLDVDHFVGGDCIADVLAEFVTGLRAALEACDEAAQSLLIPAPPCEWLEFYHGNYTKFHVEAFHHPGFPYTEILFFYEHTDFTAGEFLH